MNMCRTIIMALLAFSISVSVLGARMPRGSFLKEPAHSAAQLANQVRRDPVVAQRFEMHYGVSAADFAQYVQSQLGLRKLAHGGNYIVYHVKPTGAIGYKVRRLRSGTLVFVHRASGKAVLLAECGNPIGRSLPGFSLTRTLIDVPATVRSTFTTTAQRASLPEPPLPPAVTTLESDVHEDTTAMSLAVAEVPLWEADNVLWIPDDPTPYAPSMFAAPVSASPLFVAGLGGLLLIGSGTGRSTGGEGTPTPVPEPGGLVLWALGGGALFAPWKLLLARRR